MHKAASLRRCRPRRTLLVAGLLLAGTGALLSASARGADTSWSTTRVEYGRASWYGPYFHGRTTASGERFRMGALTAAHRYAPLGTHAVVTNLHNGNTVRVRINDRGPYVRGRVVDVSYGAARSLGMVHRGVIPVKVEFLSGTEPAEETPLTVAIPEPPPTFVVQAGAFSDQERAALVQQALADYAPQVWTSAVQKGSTVLYRVRFGLFPNRDAAENLAREIEQYGFATSVVPLR